jgi:hypothetical protein
MREATHVYDWTTTLRAVQKNLNRDQTLPTFHDDRLTHNLLWSIATIHLKLEITNEHGRHLGCSQHLTQSWAEGGDHHPTLLESTRLLNDGWIRECRTHTRSSLFYEFILPARGCEVITNGVRFMVYGPWTTLEEACHAREWLAMMVFAGGVKLKKLVCASSRFDCARSRPILIGSSKDQKQWCNRFVIQTKSCFDR